MKNHLSIIACLFILCAQTFAQTTGPISCALEAEHFSAMQGATFGPPQNINPRIAVVNCGSGDWIRWDSVQLLNGEFDSAKLNYFTGYPQDNSGALVRLRLDSPTGTIIATIDRLGRQRAIQGEPSATITVPLSKATGTHSLVMTFEGSSNICDIDKITLLGTMTATAADAKTYYVAATVGSDGNDGLSIDHPFATIQKAASIMKPGSTCFIRQGIYRETVRPLFTGLPGAALTFQAYNNENVVISGADPITGWTVNSGSIYKAPMKWTIGEYTNQVLVDGKMAWIARYPNVDDVYQPEPVGSPWCGSGVYNWKKWQNQADPMAFPTLVCIGDNGSHGIDLPVGYIFDSNISQPEAYLDPSRKYQLPSRLFNLPADFLKGGLITIHSMWWSSFGIIAGSSARSASNHVISASLTSGGIDASGPGFVSHVFGLLDAPNEWFRQDSTLYLWAPDGGDPSSHIVEAKRRNLGFDLRSKQYVNITGIRFIATSMTLAEASFCTIDKCHFKYVSHFDTCGWWETLAYWRSPFDPQNGYSGIWVSGDHNVIQNSSVIGSAGSGIILSGERNTITNNIIHSCDYLATYQAGILVFKRDITDNTEARALTISHNTLKFNARFNVEVKAASSTPENRVRIEYNDFGPAAYALKESASLSGQSGKVEVSRNYFHGVGLIDGGDILPESDMGGGAWVIHHNVFWQGETPNAPLLTGSHWCLGGGDTSANGDGLLFNNTVVDSCMRPTRDRDTGLAIWYATNNTIYARSDTVPWKFADAANRDYSLRAGSPAIDAGHVIPGWLTTFKGTAPDLGAYEYGEPVWKAGADWQEQPWVYPPQDLSAIEQFRMNAGSTGLRAALRVMADRIIVNAFGAARNGTVLVFDARGSLVEATRIHENGTAVVQTNRHGPGIYVVKLQAAGYSTVWRVIVK